MKNYIREYPQIFAWILALALIAAIFFWGENTADDSIQPVLIHSVPREIRPTPTPNPTPNPTSEQILNDLAEHVLGAGYHPETTIVHGNKLIIDYYLGNYWFSRISIINDAMKLMSRIFSCPPWSEKFDQVEIRAKNSDDRQNVSLISIEQETARKINWGTITHDEFEKQAFVWVHPSIIK